MKPVDPHMQLAHAKAYYQPVRSADERTCVSVPPSESPPAPNDPTEGLTVVEQVEQGIMESFVSSRTRSSNDSLRALLQRADSVLAHQNRLLDDADSLLRRAQANLAYGKHEVI